jgi:sRNA-binding protein
MKKSLLVVLFGFGVGYVLGARAGRERYDLIVEKVTGVWEDPRVAKARREAARYAREQAPVLRDKAQAVAKAAPGFVADGAKATTAAAKNLADRTVTTARSVADRTTEAASTAAASAANRVGEARDAVLDTNDEDEQQF